MKNLLFLFLFVSAMAFSQGDWTFKFASTVVDKDGKGMDGFNVTVYKGSQVITSTTSDASGAFRLEIPSNGEYIVQISKPGFVTKKAAVSTLGVAPDKNKDNFK